MYAIHKSMEANPFISPMWSLLTDITDWNIEAKPQVHYAYEDSINFVNLGRLEAWTKLGVALF